MILAVADKVQQMIAQGKIAAGRAGREADGALRRESRRRHGRRAPTGSSPRCIRSSSATGNEPAPAGRRAAIGPMEVAMSDEADHTRRWLINASGAAILSSAIPVTASHAQTAAAPAPGAAADAAEDSDPDLARRNRARRLCGERARSRVARRGRRQDQAACARHPGRDGVRLAPQGRESSPPVTWTASAASRRRW